MIRPANLPESRRPGAGVTVVAAADGTPVAVINVMGSLSLQPAQSMWEIVDELVDEARETTPVVARRRPRRGDEREGRARALARRARDRGVGTHTHVQTSDARVQPGGTAAITDVGMTGPHDSVIGVKAELATHRMRTGMPVRFEVADGRRADRGRARRVRRRERPGDRDQAGSGSLALDRSSPSAPAPTTRTAKSGDEHEVAHEHEPRRGGIELLHELPVVAREPEPREGARDDEQRDRGDAPRLPGRARRSPSSQTRNCGERTLPNATNATTAAAA